MTDTDLLDLLSFEKNLQDVKIISEEELTDGASFIRAELQYPDDCMTVPFVHYDGQDWIFTPYDWQGWLPGTPEEISEITWRVDDTNTEGIMLGGLPRLAPWVDEQPNPRRETRKRIGEQLRAAREEQGISIRALADTCGINKSQVCRVEAGRLNVGIDSIAVMAHALGLELMLSTD